MEVNKPSQPGISSDGDHRPAPTDQSVTTLGFNLNRWVQGLKVRPIRSEGEGVINVVTSPDGSQPPKWIEPVFGEEAEEEVIEGSEEEDKTIE